MDRLERALKHFDKLVEHGLLDLIDKRAEEYGLIEMETAVLTKHHGEHHYFSPDDGLLEENYADAFAYSVSEMHRSLWPAKG
jgi:hypothetical protein